MTTPLRSHVRPVESATGRAFVLAAATVALLVFVPLAVTVAAAADLRRAARRTGQVEQPREPGRG